MRVLIATDAWHPQVNGVVRTLTSLQSSARQLGADIGFLTPDGFPSLPVPTYPGLRLALPGKREVARRIEVFCPDVVHIATEGTIGHRVRAYCLAHKRPFATSFHTKFPEYIAARFALPETWTYRALRRFHDGASVTMAATASLIRELSARGFSRLELWARGVDTELFRPAPAIDLDLPRPVFMNVGRIAVEKNLDAFLSLSLPGSKVVIGEGPYEAELRRRYPSAHFLGARHGAELASHLATADVFVFPSRTDTFGIVQLEAMACGVPVAAFPVTGPQDLIAGSPAGVLDADLGRACCSALKLSREACRAFALGHSWDRSARQFLHNLESMAGPSRSQRAPA